MKTNRLLIALLAALPAFFAHAAETEPATDDARPDSPQVADPETATRLDTVVSIGNHRDQRLGQIAGTASVIESDTPARHLAASLADLVRYEPGVSVVEDSTRFGATGFSIRGLDGNRVGMSVDGVPVRDAFSVGSFSSAGRNAVEPALLARTEMLRGPASTMHGSDALAGVVGFHTIAPADLLLDEQQALGVRAGLASNTRDQSVAASAGVAHRFGELDWLVAVVDRRGKERENNPRPGGLEANPQDRTERTVLLKFDSDALLPGQTTLTLERRTRDVDTDVRSLVRGPSQYASTNAMLAEDSDKDLRAALSFGWPAGALGLDTIDSTLSFGRTRIDQFTQQWRDAEPPRTQANRRDRRFLFDQDALGLDVVGEKRASWLGAEHWHVFGLSASRQSAEEQRDGLETNLVTGVATSLVLGERFPVRDFPETVSREFGLYWQDEITLGDRWSVIPGLRFERFRVDARPDAMYFEDNPGQVPVDLADEHLSPKLGARFDAGAGVQLFGQYAEGFRLPPAGDLNIGFTVPAFNYIALPNPNLKPESSKGLELGARWSGPVGQVELVAFENRYRNLIESRVNLGRNSQGQLVFQSQNRARASIRGVELRGDAGLPWAGFSMHGALAWTEGRDHVRDQPLNSIDPAKLTLGVVYVTPGDRHRFEIVGTAIARKDEVATAMPAAFETPGTGLVDAYWRWQLSDSIALDVGAFNLGDRRWWSWSSVRGLAADAREIDLATQPGRHVAVNVQWQW